ncbi:MAG: TldD/PmbA family protein [Chloroflexi bacterium]|nr:TldD/PmbA family protein [Chloroflexota bacterium]
MLEEREIRRVLETALRHSAADQTEASLFVQDSALTRFANNYVHQNVAERDTTVLVRAVFGKKIGVASVNSTDEAAIRSAVERASDLARHQIDNPDFRSLPGPGPVKEARAYVAATAECTPEQRARAVDVICSRAKDQGLVTAGTFSTGVSQFAIANSLGVFAHHADTLAECTAVVMSDTSSGYADRRSLDVRAIDPEAIATEAVDKARRGRDPETLETGEYEVLLEEYAVSDLLDFLAYLGFSALAVQEGHSFMAGRFGQPIVGSNISIWDDGLGEGTVPTPFDFEGVPKQRVDLITDGVANAVCYDSYTAGKEGKESTGHALPAGETFGPVPLNLYLRPGDASKEDLLRGIRRGIWVTRFWYTRVVHPLTVTVTGMTRDGTFLIENGEITRPVKNFRFTQSYLEALRHVERIGRDLSLQRTMFPSNLVPALHIGRWNFTGVTEY